jgi:hypothetical protein
MRTAIIFGAMIIGQSIIHSSGAPKLSESWQDMITAALGIAVFWDLLSGGDR